MRSAGDSRLSLPFSEADSSTTRKNGGTGLGPSISRQLVEAMGGTIGVESEPGNGSIFGFTLAFCATVSADPWPANAGSTNAQRRALVVGDNGAKRNIVRRQLASVGLLVERVRNGAEALAMLRATGEAQAFDITFINMKMPGMDDYLAKPFPKEQLARALAANGMRVAAAPSIEDRLRFVATVNDSSLAARMRPIASAVPSASRCNIQSTFAPESRTILPSRGMSSRSLAVNSSGVMPPASNPRSCRRLMTSGALSAFAVSV